MRAKLNPLFAEDVQSNIFPTDQLNFIGNENQYHFGIPLLFLSTAFTSDSTLTRKKLHSSRFDKFKGIFFIKNKQSRIIKK